MGYIRDFYGLYQGLLGFFSFGILSAFQCLLVGAQFDTVFLAFRRFHLVAASSVVFTTKQTLPRKVAFKLNLICTNQGFNKVTLKFQSLLQIHLTSLFTLTLHIRKQPVKSQPTPTPTHSHYYYIRHQFLQYFKLL